MTDKDATASLELRRLSGEIAGQIESMIIAADPSLSPATRHSLRLERAKLDQYLRNLVVVLEARMKG